MKRGSPIPVQWSPLSSKKKRLDPLTSLSTPVKKNRALLPPQPPSAENEIGTMTTAVPCIWKRFASDLQEWMSGEGSNISVEKLKEDLHEATENALLSSESVNDCISFLNVVVSYLKLCTAQKQRTDGIDVCFLLIQLFFTIINTNQEKKLCIFCK